MIFVDANYFLRFFLDDNHRQHLLASDLFTRASIDKVELCTDLVVIFEVYWVLKRYYGAGHFFVDHTINNICHLEFIDFPEKQILFTAISNFTKFNYDLEDAYHFYSAQSQGATSIATFDKKLLKKYQSLTKLE